MALTKIDDRGLKTPIDLIDNEKIRLGTHNDLEVFHDGSNSYIKDVGTGNLLIDQSTANVLYLRSDDLRLSTWTGTETYIDCNVNGSVELYYDDVKKLETTSTGAAVIGSLGVGTTTSPLKKLHISDAGDVGIALQTTNANTNKEIWEITCGSNASSEADLVLQSRTDAGSGGSEGIRLVNGGAVQLYYNNVKTFATEDNGAYIYGPEGGIAQLMLYADEGDDNADKWRMASSASASQFNLYNYNDGAWETSIECNGSGAVELYYDNAKVFYTTAAGAIVKRPSGGETQFQITGCEGNTAELRLVADDGDDNADYWKVKADTVASGFYIQNYESGSWEESIKAHGGGNVELYYDNSKSLETWADGIKVYDLENNTCEVQLTTAQGDGGSLYADTAASPSGAFGLLTTAAEWAVKSHNNGNVELYHDGTKKFYTDANGVTVTGNLAMGSAGDGINFGADSHATGADSELLDDYEEGDWTATYGSALSSVSYHSNSGRYTKVGNLVTVTARIHCSAATTSGNDLTITGLPFTASSSLCRGGMDIIYQDNWYSSSSGGNAGIMLQIDQSTTNISIWDGDGTATDADAFYDVKRHIQLKGFYYV